MPLFNCMLFNCVCLAKHNPQYLLLVHNYRKVPKFRDAKKLCCNLPKILTKSANIRVFSQKDVSGIANSEDPDQTAP